MNNTIRALILLLPVTTAALAADGDFLRCRSITDASARLACYDAVAVPAADPRSTTGKPAAQVESRTSPPATALSAPGPAAAAQPAPAQQKTDQFGLENRAVTGTIDAIESYIPGHFEGWEAKSNIKLANGQVWQITDDSSRYMSLNDPKVKIRRGALGAFYLEFEKSNHSPRVRRVQ